MKNKITKSNLWEMSPENFNNWRKRNDLISLYKFFIKKLPKFNTWLDEFNITQEHFVNAPHTGEWFIGQEQLEFVIYLDNNKSKWAITNNFDRNYNYFFKRHQKIEKKLVIKFLPYLAWAQKLLHKNKFILSDKNSGIHSDTFEYNMWSIDTNDTKKLNSSAYLFKEHIVLNLGGIEIGEKILIAERNLDFIKISGNNHGDNTSKINFSSCREMQINSARLYNLNFFGCKISNLLMNNSNLQNLFIKNSEISSPKLINSYINGFKLICNNVDEPMFERTEIQRFEYTPPQKKFNTYFTYYKREEENYRRFRAALQSSGNQDEARKCYYMERNYKRKVLFHPYIEYENVFPKRKVKAQLGYLYILWKEDLINKKEIVHILLHFFLFHAKIWLMPRYTFKALKFKILYLISLAEYILWGYGEKPSRIPIISIMIIFFYSMIYYNYGTNNTINSFINSLYFSVTTFTTLGYGDISPGTDLLKIICGSEAFIGAFLIGLAVAGFANMSKY